MMKKNLLFLLSLVWSLSVMAIPAKRGLWTTIQLADGTEVQVEKVGDEHLHWLRAADGRCFTLEDAVYVEQDWSTLEAKRQQRQASRRAGRQVIYASTSDGLGKKGTMSMGSVPSIGSYTIPVVMVQFSDTKFKSTTTVEKMTRYYNEEGYDDESGCVGSVRDYFMSQSGGQFVPTFEVVGIVTLSKSYSYYGADQGDYIDYRLDELPGDVIEAAVNTLGVDFSKYVVEAGDENHSKGVPLMAMLYAGKGQATETESTANNKLMWPCEWDAEEDAEGGNYEGVHFNSFFVGNELYSNQLMGMGVFCHEFGHALGLPDFYCTDYSYAYDDAFSDWSIMDTGAYVEDSYAPIGYNAYEKSYMGWLDLPELSGSEVILQTPEGTADSSAYIVRHSSTETFIFENRQPGTWYPSSFGSGVLVSRIAYSKYYWSNNTLNNTQSKKRACVLTADGKKMYYSASSTNLYGNSKNQISSLKNLSGSSVTIGITKVTKKTDGTIALTLQEEEDDDDDDDDVPPVTGDYVFYESFDQCEGTGGNDDSWSGSIATATLTTDNDGWTVEKGYGGDQCAKFGTGKVTGSATTPSFSFDGRGVLTFRAGAWNSTREKTSLTLKGDNASFSTTSLTLERGAFTDYKVAVTGEGTMSITFEGSGRFFLDEVKVVGETSQIQELSLPSVHAGNIYTLDGRYVGRDLQLLPKGLYIKDGKKVVR